MLGPLNINPEEHGVSLLNGFLPDELPLERLPFQYELWEDTVCRIPELLSLKDGSVRAEVAPMPILTTNHLKTTPQWQRAYHLLSFLTQAYIWEQPGPSLHLPPQIAVPMLAVSSRLGLPPLATYSALNLWNFALIDPAGDLTDVENLRSLHTFTGTLDEEWFYLISVAIEAKGAPLIPLMLEAMDAVRSNSPEIVRDSLLDFAGLIRSTSKILNRMHEKCDPKVFYDDIRPFLAGTKNMELFGLENGVFYDERKGAGSWRKHSGGSNAQSSLIQFFDIVLGVLHNGPREFLASMRNYMPGPHREFLTKLESVANIRAFVETSPAPGLEEAYDRAVNELVMFRNCHLKIVDRYIIQMSKNKRPVGPGLNIAIGSSGKSEGLTGTGGTKLMPFLEGCRNDSRSAKLG